MITHCPFCNHQGPIKETTSIEYFQYGPDENHVILSANVIVRSCYMCGGQWTDSRSDDAKTEAITKHLATQDIYLCVICKSTPVDVHNGYDTCNRCLELN